MRAEGSHLDMPQSEQSKRAPRKHVTTACVPCRESKIRCDGATPDCLNCQKKEKQCKYQHGDDKRKVSLRAATELFSARIDQLCQFIYDHGLAPPAMHPEAEQGINRVLDTLQIPRGVVNRQGLYQNHAVNRIDAFNAAVLLDLNPDVSSSYGVPAGPSYYAENDPVIHPIATSDPLITTSPDPRQSLDFALPTAESLSNIYANVATPDNLSTGRGRFMEAEPGAAQMSNAGNIASASKSGAEDDDAESESGDEAEREVIEQLSSRIGTLKLAGDGHLRFYGPTSNLNLVDVSTTSEQRPGPDVRSVRHDGQDLLNHLRIGQHVEPSLEDHLINLYFAWQNPSLYVVDRDMFTTARSQWRDERDDTPFYSEVLTNAMCSLGAAFEARYHPTFITFPKSLSEFFADRAKALLEIELDCPCVATVQALVILSSHEAACNRDARGWLYSGMSMRLAFDLGLHVDMTPYVQSGNITTAEAEVRRVAFWGSYIADHFWGFYLGRPFRMSAGDISVSKPASHLGQAREGMWYPYGLGEAQLSESSLRLNNPNQLISRQFAILWEMITPMGHILYGCADIPRHDLQRMNYKVTEDLFAWKESLPSLLQVDLDNDSVPVLPHLLVLHMQYHQIVIFFHRPWVSKSYIQPQNPKQGPGYLHARKTCINSATAVARLLTLYEKHYTFRRINNQVVAIIFTAALMLIFVTISMSSQSPGRAGSDDQQHQATMVAHLNVCFRALDELGQSFENAKRTRDFLVSLQRRWQNHMRKSASSSSKRLISASSLSSANRDYGTADADPTSTRKKKSRLAEGSVLDPRLRSASTALPAPSAGELLHPSSAANPNMEGLDLNWTPPTNDLKFLSEELGAGVPFTDENALANLGDIGPAWWESPTNNVPFGTSTFENS